MHQNHLDELKGLRNTPHDIKTAVDWFNALLTYFRQRNLSTPRQQKNYVVDVRNAIKSGFGEDHPALQVVGFDAQTWTKINQPIHDRVENRLQNTRFLTDPDAIVSRAETLLSSKTSTWADLAVVIGRRLSELLGLRSFELSHLIGSGFGKGTRLARDELGRPPDLSSARSPAASPGSF